MFKDIFWNLVDELNIICILFGFLGWYIVNIGRYYCFIDIGNLGVNLVCWFMSSFFMNFLICLYLRWLYFKLMFNDLVFWSVSDLLLGKIGL